MCEDIDAVGEYNGDFQYGEGTENLPMGPERLGIRRWCNQDIVP